MFNEALRRYAQLLKDKVQLEETQREMQHVLQDFMKKNTELPLFTKQRTKTMKCTEIQSKIQAMVSKNTSLKGLYNKAQYINTEMQEEK